VLNACYDMGDIVETSHWYIINFYWVLQITFIITIIALNKTPSPHKK
jgi:hypothetical protein